MAEIQVPLVYEGPIDTVRTHYGEVECGGILHVPEDAVEALTAGGLFREATDEEVAAAEASPVSASDPSPDAGAEPSLADLIPERLPTKLADLAKLAIELGLFAHDEAGRSLTRAELAESIKALRAELIAADAEATTTDTPEPTVDADGSDHAGAAGEEG